MQLILCLLILSNFKNIKISDVRKTVYNSIGLEEDFVYVSKICPL